MKKLQRVTFIVDKPSCQLSEEVASGIVEKMAAEVPWVTEVIVLNEPLEH